MNKSILFGLTLLLLISIVNATPDLRLSNSTLNLEVTKNNPENFTLTLSNYGDEDIYYVKFTNISGITFPEVFNISKAESSTQTLINSTTNQSYQVNSTTPTNVTYQFTVSTDSVFEQTKVSTISFYYHTKITENNIEEVIDISNSGFDPNEININQYDNITFTNTESENHSVTDTLLNFDYNLAPSGQTKIEFDEIRNYTIFDRVTGNTLKVNVANRTKEVLTHSADYDEALTINLKSNEEESDISLNVFISEFEMNYEDTVESVLRVLNNGNKTAYNVSLNLNWTEFEYNNFNLDPYESKLIKFNVTPDNITKDSKTGKWYFFNMTAQGDNFDKIYHLMSIYIKPHNFSQLASGGSVVYLLDPDKIKEVCDLNPDICPKEYEEKIELIEIEKQYNVTGSDLKKFTEIAKRSYDLALENQLDYKTFEQNTLGHIQDINMKVDEFNKEMEGYNETIALFERLLNKSLEEMDEKIEPVLKKKTRRQRLITTILILSFLGLGMSYAGNQLDSERKKKKKIKREGNGF